MNLSVKYVDIVHSNTDVKIKCKLIVNSQKFFAEQDKVC